MKNHTNADEAKVFARIYAYALSSLYRRLPLYKHPFFIRDLVRHSQEITHLVIKDYIVHNLDDRSGLNNLDQLQYLIARDVGYAFVDCRVAIYIENHLLLMKKLWPTK